MDTQIYRRARIFKRSASFDGSDIKGIRAPGSEHYSSHPTEENLPNFTQNESNSSSSEGINMIESRSISESGEHISVHDTGSTNDLHLFNGRATTVRDSRMQFLSINRVMTLTRSYSHPNFNQVLSTENGALNKESAQANYSYNSNSSLLLVNDSDRSSNGSRGSQSCIAKTKLEQPSFSSNALSSAKHAHGENHLRTPNESKYQEDDYIKIIQQEDYYNKFNLWHFQPLMRCLSQNSFFCKGRI